MTNTRLVAYALIAIGTVALLSRLTGDAGWLWVGLVAAAFLLAYRRQRLYAFLVLGSVLMGVAVGILLEGSWHWPGSFLVSLGAGFAAVDLAAPRPNRWPRTVGLGVIALGVVVGLMESGILTSWTFALVLIAGGVALITLGRGGVEVAAPGPGATPAAPADALGAPERAPSGAPAEAPRRGATPAPSEPVAPAADGASGPPPDLRTALADWRDRTAHAEGRRPAQVLSDATLDAIAELRPADLEALAKVRGIGPVKLERYGSAVLDLVSGGAGAGSGQGAPQG